MTFQLKTLALLNADLLRAVAAGPAVTVAALASQIGKDKSNTRRALGSLAEAGLIREENGERHLTPAAADQLNAIDRALNPTSGLGVSEAYHADLVPDPDQPRKDFTSDQAVTDLEELKASLIARGRIVQPIAVRTHPEITGRFIITDGERRWRAAGLVMDAGEWPHDRPLPISVQETDAKETRLSQLTANMVRADMTPLEEADAFADLIETHGMTTAGIAAEIGMSQKLVQNRLRLRQLSPDERARMALPEDDPEHLGYKAALKSLMTPREVGEGEGESGSPASAADAPPAGPVAPAFDMTISDREALLLVEIADKAERDPDPDLGAEMWTRVFAPEAMTGPTSPLIGRGLVGFRQRGLNILIRPYPFSTPYGEWLTGLGFRDHRADCLFEARAKVHGVDVARQLAETGAYATPWLNKPEEGPDTATAEARPPISDAEFEARERSLDAGLARMDEQPALIEESAEERAARQAAERETAAIVRDRETAYRFADEMVRAMADARSGAKQFGDVFVSDTCATDDFVRAAFGAIAIADAPLAGAALAHLIRRAGAMGAIGALRAVLIPTVPDTMTFARVEQMRPMTEDGAEEPDPVEDFIQAELPEGEDEHETSKSGNRLAAAFKPGQIPAVPIRQSVSPDYIVCLEDGRRFKSLKRHLRTRYDLSPEEYIARWGLPRDYPMVAPNYAKARADLARQMGLREPA